MLMDQPQGAETRGRARRMPAKRRAARWATTPWRGWRAPTAPASPRWPNYLRGRGLAAPDDLCRRLSRSGFLILEDLGDALFADVLADGGDGRSSSTKPRWKCWRSCMPNERPTPLAPDMPLFAYDEVALMAETDLLTEWFLPLALGRKASGRGISRASRLVARGAGRHRRQRAGVRASRLSRPEPDVAAGARRAWPASA